MKTWQLFTMIVATALVILWFVGNSQTFENCIKDQEKTYSLQASNDNPSAFASVGTYLEFRRICAGDFANRGSNAITALATVLLTFVTAGLIWTGFLQVRTTREQLRAYVFPDAAAVWEGTTLNTPRNDRIDWPGIELSWRNSGQTPAKNVVCWAQIEVVEPINEQRLIVPTLKNIFSNNLGADKAGTKSLWYTRALTPNEIADVRAGARAIYLFGRIEYTDIFNVSHHTDFRLSYSGLFPPKGGIMSVTEKGNDAD
jgi:hypothetical protein